MQNTHRTCINCDRIHALMASNNSLTYDTISSVTIYSNFNDLNAGFCCVDFNEFVLDFLRLHCNCTLVYEASTRSHKTNHNRLEV